MLLRFIGMLLVVVVPSVSSAQLFARGRVVGRFTARTRTCATPCCNQITRCAVPASVVQPTVMQPVDYVVPTPVMQPTIHVQPASYVQPACVTGTRTVQRTRIRSVTRGCTSTRCVTPQMVTTPTVISEEAAIEVPVVPVVEQPVSVTPAPQSIVVQPAIVESPVMVQPMEYTQPGTFVQPVGFVQGSPYVQRASTGSVRDALAIVNQRRAARGLYPLAYDPVLATTAQRKSQNRAYRRISGHDGMSKSGARAEGVGFAFGGGNLDGRFQCCHLYTTSYRSAGAAVAYDQRGAAYYTLLLR